MNRLTRRQLEVMAQRFAGRTYDEIASSRRISPHTARNHACLALWSSGERPVPWQIATRPDHV